MPRKLCILFCMNGQRFRQFHTRWSSCGLCKCIAYTIHMYGQNIVYRRKKSVATYREKGKRKKRSGERNVTLL